MSRYLKKAIEKDALASQKIAFIGGPRQVGKTTLVKSMVAPENYFSYDNASFRKLWSRQPENLFNTCVAGPIALDEIHKDRIWKRKLKGLYDLDPKQTYLVTGSARLDLYRKGSDSLLGRYIPYRLYPLTVAETENPPAPGDVLINKKPVIPWRDLLDLGGFPEPLFQGNKAKAMRWSRLRMDRLILEDSRDILAISDLNRFRLLTDLMPEKVGSPFSINSLREDVGASYSTVRSWVMATEALYFGFFIKPYSKSVKRSLIAEPKFYLFDILSLPENSGQRKENLAAIHLKKACDYFTDTAQGHFELYYLRDKEKREVDFLLLKNKKPWILVECKSSEKTPDKNLQYFHEVIKPEKSFQLIDDNDYKKAYRDGITVMSYEKFFSGWV